MIIISHSLISYFLFRWNPEKFLALCDDSERKTNGQLESVTLTLLRCNRQEELIKAVKEGIKSCLPQSTGSLVLWCQEETGQVFTVDDSGRTIWLSKLQTLWDASLPLEDQRTILQNLDLDLADQLRKIDKAANDHTPVLCSPVLNEGGDCVLAVLIIIIGEFTPESQKMLSWLKQQIAACYSHIQRTFSSTRGEDQDKASQQLIQLCGELYDQDAGKLQLKVIKYLEEQTQAECAFILLVVPETQELFCQVIGKKVLETEVRFPGHTSSFAVALETNQPIHLDDIPKENLSGIEEVVECKLQSFLCVPIASRSDNTLIALACLVNKTNANRFTDRDISCVQQCFRYTATVLTSTIAFQNERRLKLHSQALLQVARNLFTNLGELKTSPAKGFDNFPWIRSRMCEVNMYGVTASRTVKRDRYVDLCNCIIVDGGEGLEWKYPFRCHLEAESGENVNGPTELKDLALKCIKFHIEQNKTVAKPVDDKSGKNVDGKATEQNHGKNDGKATEQNQVTKLRSHDNEEKDAGKDESSPKGTKDNRAMKQSPSSKKKTEKETSPEKRPGSTDKSPEKKTKTPPQPKGFFGGWLFYQGKEADESDGENNGKDDSFDKDETLIEEDDDESPKIQYSPKPNEDLPEIQLSPQSMKSDSQVSCTSYHTASGTDVEENELAPDFDMKEMESANETYFDSWEFLNSPAGLKGTTYREYLDSISGKGMLEKRSSDGFTPETVHNTSSHEIYIEDIDSGQGHTMNTSLMNVSQSFSLDDILEGDSGLGSVTHASSKTDQSNYTSQMHANVTYETHKENEAQNQGSKEEEVITTVSAVDMTGLQCPETELLPFTQNDLTNLLREIMQQARNLTHAERCSVFLIDKETDELVAKVFDGIQANDNENEATEIRMPSTQGIAGHVATSGITNGTGMKKMH